MNKKETSIAVIEPEVAGPITPESTTAVVENKKEEPEVQELYKGPDIPIDKTNADEFSFVLNKNFSEELIQNAFDTFNLEKLKELKGQPVFYKEAIKQINTIWHSSFFLYVHSDTFSVLLTIHAGRILNEVKSTFKTKSEFTKWREENFGIEHLRFLQYAQQLANMGEFAIRYAALGKDRLVQLDHIRKKLKKASCYELFKEYPIPNGGLEELKSDGQKEYIYDVKYDPGGEILKLHFDALITLQKFHENGMNFVNIYQAEIIASDIKRPIYKKEVKKIKKWLTEEKDPQESFEYFLMDRMCKVSNRSQESIKFSLNKIMNYFVSFFNNTKFDDSDWINEQKQKVNADLLKKTYSHLTSLANKLNIDLSE